MLSVINSREEVVEGEGLRAATMESLNSGPVSGLVKLAVFSKDEMVTAVHVYHFNRLITNLGQCYRM